jgi:hypothetical protein
MAGQDDQRSKRRAKDGSWKTSNGTKKNRQQAGSYQELS